MRGWILALLILQLNPAPTGSARGQVLTSSGTPAVGVRVYAIPAGDVNAIANNPTVFESLAQTDSTGHYRLDVPAGRYFIAAGSVDSPTYFPDTPSLSAAKPVVISAGTVVDSINFTRYTPATRSPTGIAAFSLPPGSTGVLSGVIRNSDGSPASSLNVVAVPTVSISSRSLPKAITDSNGQFRMDNVPPDSYNLVTGYIDEPVFYPGTSDIALAAKIVTTPTTNLNTLNVTLPPPPKGVSVKGTVRMLGLSPASGVALMLIPRPPIHSLTPTTGGPLNNQLRGRTYPAVLSTADGSFEFRDIVPGDFDLQANLVGISPSRKSVTVSQSGAEVDLDIPVAVIAGRIEWDGGKPADIDQISEVAATTTTNPNMIATTIFPVSSTGSFTTKLAPDAYRFFVRDLPEGYSITSVMVGENNIANEELQIQDVVPADIVVHISKLIDPKGTVRGKFLDAASGSPTSAARAQLCCFSRGPVERMSTTIDPNGSFEFKGVPAGTYAMELRGSKLGVVNPTIEVRDSTTTEATVYSVPQFVSVTVSIMVEGVAGSASRRQATVTFLSVNSAGQPDGRYSISAQNGLASGPLFASVPAGTPMKVVVSDIPEGYSLKSVLSGTTNLMVSPFNVFSPPSFSVPQPQGFGNAAVGLKAATLTGFVDVILTKSQTAK